MDDSLREYSIETQSVVYQLVGFFLARRFSPSEQHAEKKLIISFKATDIAVGAIKEPLSMFRVTRFTSCP